ncbi:RNA exonuclease 1 homolog isoform X2 [Rhopilema esculentum]|uniref:RNA exonuclease 1 homolog isoform X2 n=1 Tax=Rhopilema esculentum TaxID=499914 RepID=UPI0031D8A5CE
MFPTAGYFRNVPCPFYVHGLCHRPYCHFRHSKPDTKGKRGNSSDWTYGELVEEESHESKSSTAEEELMDIIKNLSPGSKQANASSKKSVTFAFPSHGQQTVKEEETTEVTKKKKERSALKKELDKDPIPAPIIKEISDLLKITSSNDQSSKIAEELRKRKKCKKDTEEATVEVTETREEEEKGNITDADNIFDIIEEDIPKKPPKLKDIDFFEAEVVTGETKKRKISGSKGKQNLVSDQQDSSVESSSESVDNSEDTLRQIFEECDPLVAHDLAKENTISVKATSKEASSTSMGKVRETVGLGSLKKRIAHNPNVEAVRQPVVMKGLKKNTTMKPSFVSPSICNTSKLQSTAKMASNSGIEPVSKRMSFTSNDGTYIGKKRKAHTLEINEEPSVLKATVPAKKPRIPVEFGSKVPQVIRQRYLDKIIEEYTDKYSSLGEVYEKAVEEEKLIYTRCSSRQIYMNLCVNAIKKIRELPKYKVIKNGSHRSLAPKLLPDNSSKMAAELASSIVPPKLVIRPSSISLSRVDKKHSSLTGGSADRQRKTSISSIADLTVELPTCLPVEKEDKFQNTENENRFGLVLIKRRNPVYYLSEDIFYDCVQKYVASDQDLWNNNYPRESTDTPGRALYRETKGSLHATKRTCARCGNPFLLNSEGEYVVKAECTYHWGKMRRFRGKGGVLTQFSCCQGDSGSLGCSVAKLHVADYFGDLDGYVATKAHNKTNTRKVYALDCEMCYTSHGLELTRITIVDFSMKQVLDAYVKPEREIIDYNTRFSGVTEKDLEGVEISLNDVHRKLLKKFGTDTVLIGHSLESDLRALKLIHNKIVDTALIFPHRLGLPYKRALKTLMGEFLQKIIQDSDGGHDSYEDAGACMELMKWKIMEDLKKQARTTSAHVR